MDTHHPIPTNARFKSLIGRKFHRWTVVSYAGDRKWNCRCECGNLSQKPIYGNNLVSGMSKSCGCLKTEVLRALRTTHGKSHSPEHKIWSMMKDRCGNPRNGKYKIYGARGIVVCERWLKFENFLADMGPRPTGKMASGLTEYTIERRDVHGNYSPENCYWATHAQQCNNRTSNLVISHDGKTMTPAGWELLTGIPASVIRSRILKGYSHSRAVTQKLRKDRRRTTA